MTTEGTEVLFRVYVTQAKDLFGVVLFIDDQSDSEVVPCFRSVFKSSAGVPVTIDGMTEIYAECHRNAMDTIGLDGILTRETYEDKLHRSVELAADMMAKYGLSVLDLGTVPDPIMEELFEEDDGYTEEEEEPTPKRVLN